LTITYQAIIASKTGHSEFFYMVKASSAAILAGKCVKRVVAAMTTLDVIERLVDAETIVVFVLVEFNELILVELGSLRLVERGQFKGNSAFCEHC
jgi:hypothetical protein